MDEASHGTDNRRMAQKTFRKLYIGEWMAFLGKSQAEVANDVGIGASYMSQLVSAKKTRPSFEVLARIARVLELSIDDLQNPPPARAEAQAASELTPSQLATLGQLLTRIGRAKGK